MILSAENTAAICLEYMMLTAKIIVFLPAEKFFHYSGHRLTTDAIYKIGVTAQFSSATEGKCIARTTISILIGHLRSFHCQNLQNHCLLNGHH